jgi:hypothetical protein
LKVHALDALRARVVPYGSTTTTSDNGLRFAKEGDDLAAREPFDVRQTGTDGRKRNLGYV